MSKPNPIPLSAKRTDFFTPESLKPRTVPGEKGQRLTLSGSGKRELGFVIRVPTPSERDTIGSRLFELGLTTVSQETIRATMIDELYNIDWGGDPRPLPISGWQEKRAAALASDEARKAFNEEFADDAAGFLDNYWNRQSIEEHATTLWQEQEAQRLLDEAAGVVKEAAPQPAKAITVREHSKAKLLIDDVMERSSRLRGLVARQMDYGRLNAQLMARLHLLDLTPAEGVELPEDLVLERGADGLVTVDSIDRLREYIGMEAWGELVDRIDNQFTISEEERKNSDSPPERPSDPTGSPEPSVDSENSGGSATASSTGRARTGGSGMTTGKSSGSSSGSGGGRRKPGRTAAG